MAGNKSEELIAQLNETINHLRDLAVMVEDFPEGAQEQFNDKIDSLIQMYKGIRRNSDAIEVEIPERLVSIVDDNYSNNPDGYTKSFIEQVVEQHCEVTGKVKALESLIEALNTEI